MFVHPQFDPIALELGPLAIRWYGLMYLLAFAFVMILGRLRIRKGLTTLTAKDLDDVLYAGVLGVVLGGRLGYVLFYRPAYYLEHPADILAVWQGGMSFHGGLLGVIAAMAWIAWRRKWSFWTVSDFIAPLVPLGLAAGRMGNFINAELWGRPTDAPWAVIFPQAQDGLGRHASQLYQFGMEGLALFALLWVYARRARPLGAVSGLFLAGYGFFRLTAEYFREPDSFLGMLSLGFSMGQLLCLPMIVLGLGMLPRKHAVAAGVSGIALVVALSVLYWNPVSQAVTLSFAAAPTWAGLGVVVLLGLIGSIWRESARLSSEVGKGKP